MTIGELGRRIQTVEGELKDVGKTLTAIQTTLAGQSVKVGVVWAGLGLGASALVTSLVGTSVAILAK